MFKFIVGICLIGFLYLGFEFISVYKAESAPPSEVIAQSASTSDDELNQGLIDMLTTPVSELTAFHEQVLWVLVWGVGLFVWFGAMRLWISFRDKRLYQ